MCLPQQLTYTLIYFNIFNSRIKLNTKFNFNNLSHQRAENLRRRNQELLQEISILEREIERELEEKRRTVEEELKRMEEELKRKSQKMVS